MQLTNAVVAAILAAEAMAAPHTHGAKRGSSLASRAAKFGASKVGGDSQAFGGDEGSWGFGQGGNSGSFGPSGTAAAPAASTATGSSSASKASSSSVAPVESSASSTESTSGSSVDTSTKSATTSSSSFSSLTTMSNTQWAGAGYSGLYSSGETLQGVSATFNVLDISVPTDADTGLSTYYASAWIGIDGQGTCSNSDAGLWQAGVDSEIDSSGTQSFYAWYEWYPADTVVIDIGTISAGDLISMNLTASSGSEGTIVVENTSTGKTFSKTVTSSNEICLDTVEWIMEDITFAEDDEGLASFSTLTFSDAAWVTDAGTYTAAKANEHYEITDRTSTSISGENVVIEYV